MVCPLCKTKHPPHFYCYVKRKVKQTNGHNQVLSVVRIICPVNREKRKKTSNPLQYTLTLLPAFLIPYSTVPVDKVECALTEYAGGKMSDIEAAMLMGCENVKSFRHYWKRAQARISAWLMLLVREMAALNVREAVNLENSIGNSSFAFQWQRLHELMELYYSEYQKMPGSNKVDLQFCFLSFHAKLTQNKMGLGP